MKDGDRRDDKTAASLRKHRCASVLSANVLVLNHNYEPLNLTSVRRAIVLILKGRAEVVKHNDSVIRYPSGEMAVPSVVRLSQYARRPPVRVKLSKKSILARDNYTCQYCGYSGPGLTVDHVIPRERGGNSDWDNLVCCCVKCNIKKGNRTPEEANMHLQKMPRRPAYIPHMGYSKLMIALKQEEWREFLLPFVRER
ncbi:MAG: HNH endonuclease [Armatimonadota bacterium]|nr:HNH endonuclease [Armatimonadota bacterium]MCX7776786.1 HNH endonuclease [Armatimonadota bacterium]MDW8024583.1 HNH endonuclease [Armatimonadota bacterium]